MYGWKNDKKEEEDMEWKTLNLMWHYVEKWADKKPDADAMVFEDERLTWGDFKKEVDSIAKAYLEAGVKKGRPGCPAFHGSQ